MIQSNKAETKLLAIWWFLVLIIVSAGIILGTSFFRADKIDVRQAEASIMVEKLSSCLVSNGHINQQMISSQIFDSCYLNEKIVNASSIYLGRIRVYDSSNKLIKEYSFGNNALEANCKIGEVVANSQKFPRCSEKTFFASDFDGKIIQLNLLVVSNHEFIAE